MVLEIEFSFFFEIKFKKITKNTFKIKKFNFDQSPYGTSAEEWRDAYKSAISIIRSSGWGGLLLVDASAYAQNPNVIVKYGKELVSYDTFNNIAFSLHMYAEWKKGGNF